MFNCCQGVTPEYQYQVRTLGNQDNNGSPKYYNTLDDIDKHILENEHTQITKVRTQQNLPELINKAKQSHQKFTDETFPASNSSIGNEINNVIWKRIPEIIRSGAPTIFDNKIEPSDVITGHQGDCYLLSALAALAESPAVIRNILGGQVYNEEGIYKLNLRVHGVVEEVVVDDFIPIHENGLPLFCQPNPKTGEFWVVLLEKALAKSRGSYALLNEGTPSQIFRAVTHAPSQSMLFEHTTEQKEKIWNLLSEYAKKHQPFCATTIQQSKENSLQSSHTYTIVSAAVLESEMGPQRLVKLRNPWSNVEYSGRGSSKDNNLWNSINDNENKANFLKENNNCDYGLFTMVYDDFFDNFNQIHYCNLGGGGKFVSEPVTIGNKASLYEIAVDRQGLYNIELNQSPIFGQTEEQRKEEGICRSTLLLVRKQKTESHFTYHFVNGVMKFNQENTILTEHLLPGNYILYAKIDPTCHSHKLPESATINLYSKNFASLTAVPRTKYPTLKSDAFFDHGLHNKKNQYNEGKIWLSWQLLFQKGGFAYIAVSNAADSNQAVAIKFSEEDFSNYHFKLKKPLKGLGNEQSLRILPGTNQIILARIINDSQVKSVRFPPKLDIKLEPLH